MTRALVTQMLNALEHHQSQTRPIHKTEFAITAAREYLATEPKQLGTITFGGCPACGKQSCIARSCMTPVTSGDRAELIARLAKQWAELDPADPYRADVGKAADMLEADAQQAKRVPMTEKQIDKIHADTARLAQIRTTFFIAFARALEAHHKILPADKPTDWSAA
jgi:hypothetical protein